MRAIVTNVKKLSNYHQYNGLTFNVKEVLGKIIALQIPSLEAKNGFATVDFSFKEVTIIDIENELQNAYDDFKWGSDSRRYDNLKLYCQTRGFTVPKSKYNCPV
jgi:hypothetical protein